jgi:hypothetical protein
MHFKKSMAILATYVGTEEKKAAPKVYGQTNDTSNTSPHNKNFKLHFHEVTKTKLKEDNNG